MGGRGGMSMDNPVKGIVLLLEDGRAINVEVSSVKNISMTYNGKMTSIIVEFDVPYFEIQKLTSGHKELGDGRE
jgi:hypothetical protein